MICDYCNLEARYYKDNEFMCDDCFKGDIEEHVYLFKEKYSKACQEEEERIEQEREQIRRENRRKYRGFI